MVRLGCFVEFAEGIGNPIFEHQTGSTFDVRDRCSSGLIIRLDEMRKESQEDDGTPQKVHGGSFRKVAVSERQGC